jgi:hypothetical protein
MFRHRESGRSRQQRRSQQPTTGDKAKQFCKTRHQQVSRLRAEVGCQ